jgi:hypothetical protein
MFCLALKGAAYMTPYKTTWENAISNCTIETPTIIFKGTEQDLSVAVNATMIGNEEVWVGYYLAATAFNYVGKYINMNKYIKTYGYV